MRKSQPSTAKAAFNFVLLIGVANLFVDVMMGFLYGISIPGLVIFSVLLQLIALPLLAVADLRPSRVPEHRAREKTAPTTGARWYSPFDLR